MFGSNYFAQSYFGQGYPLASIDWVVTATITGTSSATAIISDAESLVSSISGSSSLVANLVDYTAIISTIAGSSSMSASIDDADFIVANLSGSSSMSSDISDEEFIQGLFTGSSLMVSDISDEEFIQGLFTGSSSATATISDTDNLTVAVTGSSLLSAMVFIDQPLSAQQIYDALNPNWWTYNLNYWNTGYYGTQINFLNNGGLECIYLSTAPIQNYGINEGDTGVDPSLLIDNLRQTAAQYLESLRCSEVLGYTKLNPNQIAGAQQ